MVARVFMPGYYLKSDFDALVGGGLAVYNSIGTVGSPGELRTNVGSVGSVCFVTGFATPDDGGGGIFRWVVGSTTDNGGTKIIPGGSPGGYWQRQFEGSVYNIKWFGCSSSLGDNGPIINSIITTISTDSAILYVPHDPGGTITTYTIGTNVTIPTNIELYFETPGSQFSVSNTITLTINSEVQAGLFQIFDGLGDIVFNGGKGHSEWFDEINDAVNSGLKLVYTSGGVHEPTVTIDVPNGVRWEGYSSDQGLTGYTTIIKPTSAVNEAVKLYEADSVTIKEMTLRMDNMTAANTVGPATTISFTTAADGGTISDSASGFGSLSGNTLIGIVGSSLNDGTYHVTSATASTLTVKGVSLKNESAGASITIYEGPIGLRLQGSKRGYFQNLDVVVTTAQQGMGGIYMTPRDNVGFSSYYNHFVNCGVKSQGTKKGIGVCSAAYGAGAITNNMFSICPVQSWDIDYMMASTGSGFQLIGCNGESAGSWGIYVTDVPSATATAVKVKNGEWTSANAGEIEALLMEDCTINGTVGTNVTVINLHRVLNDFCRADYYIGEEGVYNTYGAGATIDPVSTYMRVEGASAAITLDTTTPISTGSRGQQLVLVGNSNTNTVTMVNSGNVSLSQDIWYGKQNAVLVLHYSNTATKWLEVSRIEPNPLVFRTRQNALLAYRTDETELTLSGTSTSWSSAISVDDEVLYVLVRVTELITGSGVTGFLVGRNGDTNHWGNITGTSVGTVSYPRNFTDRTRYIATAAQDIIITATGGSFTGGKIRVSYIYRHADPPDA